MNMPSRTILALLLSLIISADVSASDLIASSAAESLIRENAPSTGNRLWSARSGGFQPRSGFGLDGHLNDDNVGATLVLQPDGNLSVFSSLAASAASEPSTTSVPWCAEASGLLRIGSLGQQCLMQGVLQFELPGQIASTQTGVNFSGQNWDATVSYGLSWLMDKLDLAPAQPNRLFAQQLGVGAVGSPVNVIDAQVQGLSMGAQWRLTEQSALQLNAALNQLRMQNNTMIPGLNINQAQAGVGMVYGPFSGNISGHLQRARGPTLPGNALWGGLDLGVSWRTPWRGELTVGARNLVTKGEDVLLPDPQSSSIDRTSTRTPYVRYKQDL